VEVQYAACLSRQQTGPVGSLQQSAREHGQRKITQRVPAGRVAVPNQSRGNREYNFNVYYNMHIYYIAGSLQAAPAVIKLSPYK